MNLVLVSISAIRRIDGVLLKTWKLQAKLTLTDDGVSGESLAIGGDGDGSFEGRDAT